MAQAPIQSLLAAAEDQRETISVRMYRGLLGDCFLLTHTLGGEVYRALIDCGVLQCIGSTKVATKAAVGHMQAVVNDLAEATARTLDLVIATHEHYDHLSGFILHHDVFETFTIKAVWLAWTENDKDDLATAIRNKHSKGLSALHALVAEATAGAAGSRFGLRLDSDAAQDRIARISDLLQFYGEIDDVPSPTSSFAASRETAKPRAPKLPPRSCADVFYWLKQKAGDAGVKYLEPGQQIDFGIKDRLRAITLGPPRTRTRLLQLDPDANASEVYLAPADVDEYLPLAADVSSLLAADRGPSKPAPAATSACQPLERGPERRRPELNLPFADLFDRWQEPPTSGGPRGEQPMQDGVERWQAPISEPLDHLAERYYDHDPVSEARRIDGEWLGSAETLALKIDGDVNNTSLALAIEVTGGRVLLFPADAQVGNWLSWHDQKYPSAAGKPDADGRVGPSTPGENAVSATDILSRVVFYKVGHHGSHNATVRDQGLELMTSPSLVAMIPVVEAVAREQKTRSNPNGWAMPYDKLHTRLKIKTSNRIISGDGKIAEEKAAFSGSIFELDYAQGDDPLWVRLTLGVGA
ncbi:hypothetical protein KZ820_07200 [Sphingomonas sp. RRHST34]|uniref:Metallo-beta-lactamase domain-containing protein n=1 Tax=Sphingomonas citri TaxID=2862499 RepID=A0ABS7BLM8_9SPHN|nr:hypothetical protein [Sphingomonas citri]MBW6530519.1 hypothetical protein [Sphingomonas citri]